MVSCCLVEREQNLGDSQSSRMGTRLRRSFLGKGMRTVNLYEDIERGVKVVRSYILQVTPQPMKERIRTCSSTAYCCLPKQSI
jgi:hypothetical protein